MYRFLFDRTNDKLYEMEQLSVWVFPLVRRGLASSLSLDLKGLTFGLEASPGKILFIIDKMTRAT